MYQIEHGYRMRSIAGLGASTTQAAVDALIKRAPTPTPEDVTSFFKGLPKKYWSEASTALVIAGVPGDVIRSSMYQALQNEISWIKGGLTMLSAALTGFHGARRNGSIFWGGVWFVAGLTWPVFTPVVAVAQGFAKRKG